MSNINQVGTFRGDVVDRGMSNSSGGYPQVELQLRATEKYNDQAEVWEPWDYEEVEARAYLVLFGANNKPTLNVRQCMRALGWDGVAFSTLNQEGGLLDKIQWRMESQTYEGVDRLKVVWIDAYDAEPGRKVQKLEASDIRALDAKYAASLKAISGGPKPATARPQAPTPGNPAYIPAPIGVPTTVQVNPTQIPSPVVPNTTVVPAQSAQAVVQPAEVPSAPTKRHRATKAEMDARRAAAQPTTAVVAPPQHAPPQATNPILVTMIETPTGESLDQASAWDAWCKTARSAKKTDLELTNIWTAVIKEIGGDGKVGEDWSGVVAEMTKRLTA